VDRRSKNPRPSKIEDIAFSIRAIRVADCFAPAMISATASPVATGDTLLVALG
jgi:hypothetical protein